MNDEIKRVYVVAADTRDFQDYWRSANLVPGHTAIWVASEHTLRGRSGPIEVVFTDRAPARSDYERIRTLVQVINNTPIPAVPRLDAIEGGQAFLIGGTPLVVTSVYRDAEGCIQVVFSRRESHCHNIAHGAPQGRSIEFNQMENARIELSPPLHRSVPPEDLYDIKFAHEEVCKCGFRAPELGPHPMCKIHGGLPKPDAHQWFKNGDHPLDHADGRPVDWEGAVVRYYRRPDVPGDTPCRKCGAAMHVHGWIDAIDHVVCPGDWLTPDGQPVPR